MFISRYCRCVKLSGQAYINKKVIYNSSGRPRFGAKVISFVYLPKHKTWVHHEIRYTA